jgi:hypothetical protein
MSEEKDKKIDLGFKDVQGVIAIGVVCGVFIIAGTAIWKGADVVTVLNNVLPLGAMVIGFYFGKKSAE